jgi:2-keto-4-pentenoate hydratase/2-oxohepta-3-ene-1,7-dioic acid hydratase in catechol pathway
MKVASFEHGGETRIGVVDPNSRTVHIIGSLDMVNLIRGFEPASARFKPTGGVVGFDDLRFLAPIPRPSRNIFCVGKNYREHALEFSRSGYEAGAIKGAEIDEYPAVFTKPASCVVGAGASVETHPLVTSSVDYEGELAVIIGRGGRGIERQDALSHVFGYTIVNDVTARDRQKNHKQWFLGKSLDTFCPMGPWITTADEVDVGNLAIRTWVNKELRQNANTRDLIFDVPSLIETISAGLTLVPGDIIATGTPAGVGVGLRPPTFLKSGDLVEIEIEGLGRLSNPFV